MFVEPPFNATNVDDKQTNIGWIEVIAGCMFSGKTEELIRRLRRAIIAKQRVEIFKPTVDTRYHLENVVSHNQNSIRSTPIISPKELLLRTLDCDVIGIDEAQFFDESLPEVLGILADKGKRIIVAGLDMDSNGKPFGPMPQLLAMAEFVSKVHAICMKCGSVANYSYRLVKDEQRVLLGEKDLYEARCRKCFNENSVSSASSYLSDYAS